MAAAAEANAYRIELTDVTCAKAAIDALLGPSLSAECGFKHNGRMLHTRTSPLAFVHSAAHGLTVEHAFNDRPPCASLCVLVRRSRAN